MDVLGRRYRPARGDRVRTWIDREHDRWRGLYVLMDAVRNRIGVHVCGRAGKGDRRDETIVFGVDRPHVRAVVLVGIERVVLRIESDGIDGPGQRDVLLEHHVLAIDVDDTVGGGADEIFAVAHV